MKTRIFPLFLLFTFSLTACDITRTGIEPLTAELVDEMVRDQVSRTLEAIAKESAQISITENEPPEPSFSIEVTQQPEMEEKNPELIKGESEPNSLPYPESHYIWNIWGHRQHFPIGCEASAADDWAKYFGVEVNEFKFQVLLPVSDNPDTGFVGDVNGPWGQVPPYAYGVHAEPIADVLQTYYRLPAEGVRGFTIEQLKSQIAADKPVIAWVIGNCTWSEPYKFFDKEGNKVVTAPYEHVVIVTGYNADSIRYMNNGKFYDIPTEYFERSWAVLGNMVVYYRT